MISNRRASSGGFCFEVPMSVIVEPMRETDMEAVVRLRFEAFFVGSSRTRAEEVAGLSDLMTGDGFECALVARTNGALVGSALMVRHELESPHSLSPWLAGLVVAPAYRRSGIGAALVRAVEAHALSVGAADLYLYTWQSRDFYAARGWGAVETFEQHGDPMLLMARSIRANIL
jgi:predicted N-acetyltransferase YhbS